MNYVEGQTVICDMLCRSFEQQTASTGKRYYTGVVCDKESSFPIKVWNVLSMEPGKVYHLSVQCKTYNSKQELHVSSAIEMPEACIDDFVQTSPVPFDTLLQEFQNLVHMADSDQEIKQFMQYLLTDECLSKFFEIPAGARMHQDYRHGLLEHIVHVTTIAKTCAGLYAGVDLPLLIAACLLHDVGKVQCMDYTNYTVSYNVTNASADHLMVGFAMFSQAAEAIGMSKERKLKLLNCVASHHSTMNGWTGTKPACVEAVILSYSDGVDASTTALVEDLADGATFETIGSRTRVRVIKE